MTMLLLALVFSFAWMCTGFAQEKGQTTRKETKPAVAGDVKKQEKTQTKPRTMKYVTCSQQGCGFWAKSHSAKELRGIMKRHAKKYHKADLTYEQLKKMVQQHDGK